MQLISIKLAFTSGDKFSTHKFKIGSMIKEIL